MMRLGSENGSGRSSTVFTRLKMAVRAADSKRNRQDRRERKTWGFLELAKRKAEILQQRTHAETPGERDISDNSLHLTRQVVSN